MGRKGRKQNPDSEDNKTSEGGSQQQQQQQQQQQGSRGPGGRGQGSQQLQGPGGRGQGPPQGQGQAPGGRGHGPAQGQGQSPGGRGHGPPQGQGQGQVQGGRGHGPPQGQGAWGAQAPGGRGQGAWGAQAPGGRGSQPQQSQGAWGAQAPVGRGQSPPQPQQTPVGRGHGPPQGQETMSLPQTSSQPHQTPAGRGQSPRHEQTPGRTPSAYKAQGDSPSPKPGWDNKGGQKSKSQSPPTHEFRSMKVDSEPVSSIPADIAKKLLMEMPKRSKPNVCGTKGRPISVYTNMMSIDLGSQFKTNAVHYDVEVDPDRPKFLMRTVFEALRVKHFKNRFPAFDGRKNAYSAGDLPFGDAISDEVVIFDKEQQRERPWKIKVTKVANIDLSWLKQVKAGFNIYQVDAKETALQVLDVIFRHGPASIHVPVGRSIFYVPTGRVVTLGNGMDLWIGVFQSAVTGWKPFLNVDVAHKGFPKTQNVVELMKELCTDPRSRNPEQDKPQHLTPEMLRWNKEKINKYMRGLKVIYEIPGIPSSQRTHRVNELGPSPREHKFTSDTKTYTIEEYFLKEKNYKIREPLLPSLWIGNKEKHIYVPVELCRIKEGQATQRKLDETQTSKMIKAAATNTDDRKRKIQEGFNRMRYNENPTVREFGLSVTGEFEKVPARVLEPPRLEYKDRTMDVRKGVWRAGKFLQPQHLPENSWTIMALTKRINYDDLVRLKDRLMSEAYNCGMNIQAPLSPYSLFDIHPREAVALKNHFEALKTKNIKLVVVVIPDSPEAYSKVKQITELNVGLLTQCLKMRTLGKLDPATVGNILLKINTKLNGVNHTFSKEVRPTCLLQPCMLVGADVTHPSPDAKDTPSIAAVAASHDPKAFMFNIEIKLQGPRVEIIQDFEEIMMKQIRYFMNKTKHPPLQIVYFRDGVSEGQLATVLYYEIEAIRSAVRKLKQEKHIVDTFLGRYPNWNPPITCLVVQKRHHIRLFPADKGNSDDRNGNVQAGTIVDTHITHALGIDFYLVSHASIQGTARPTKYRCICNEINMNEDEIERLTYYLCHMFSRCCRSVSYPAPTYYAHLAAFRARALTYGVPINTSRLKEEQEKKLNLRFELRDSSPMFFV